MKRVVYGYFIIAAFILALTFPLVQFIAPVITVPEINENRVKACQPAVVLSDIASGVFMRNFDRYFNDHYGFRDMFIRIDKWISFYLVRVSGNPQVVIGKNGFFFMRDTAKDYDRMPTFSEEDAAGIAQKLKMLQNELRARGIKFLFTIGPNTNTIYSEAMPAARKYPAGISNYDLLRKYLLQYKINYLDLSPLLFEEKKHYLLYYKRDSHWNRIAGALVADKILKQLDASSAPDHYIRIKALKQEIRESDLNILLGINPLETAFQPVVEYAEMNSRLPKTIWLHDSYSWAIFPYVQPFFEEFYNYHYSETSFYGVIAANMENAKIVVLEIAEHALPYLLKMNYDFLKERPEFGKLRVTNLHQNQYSVKQQLSIIKSSKEITTAVSDGDDPQLVWDLPEGRNVKYLSLGLSVPSQTKIQIFWKSDARHDFSEASSAALYSTPFRSEYIFDLHKAGKIKLLRIDPCNKKGIQFELKSVKIFY